MSFLAASEPSPETSSSPRRRTPLERLHRYLGDYLIGRWLFLRALGLIYFSAFFALLFQVRGLIGPDGILPASDYLPRVAQALGPMRFWYAPTLLWFSASSHMLVTLCWVGLISSMLLAANVWPRLMLAVCFVCFLSFVSAAQDFSSYQSDGMLLEAGFLSLFFAPAGLLPGWGARRSSHASNLSGTSISSLVTRAAQLLLLWEWLRIYFESGVVKLLSGDPTWRNLTAMYEYYQNGPLPTWIGWYLQHLPHWFHIATAALTLAMELVLVFLAFLPRRGRLACFFIVTAWQIGVILTANYAFLNYLVLALAFLLLDDHFFQRFVPARWRPELQPQIGPRPELPPLDISVPDQPNAGPKAEPKTAARPLQTGPRWTLPRARTALRLALAVVFLPWIFYAATVPLVMMFWRNAPLPALPVTALEPFRIANQYGLFAVITPHRYEIEFQGSNDGSTWTAYTFRYKPQELTARPRIYAPYQPRFDWNLWFASLGTWTDYPLVPRTEEQLLVNDRDVLGLFKASPFSNAPPRYVRAVLWQYWFSTPAEKRANGAWWRRELIGTYTPTLTRSADGHYSAVGEPTLSSAPEP